jgi:hypothetical protein
LIPNPITRVLSTFAKHRVQFLLMGGQACVLYGAAEFSRDLDVTVLTSAGNWQRLEAALSELRAEVIAVPPFEAEYLERGHAVHFRCEDPIARHMRVDVMSKMRGVAGFTELWDRRTTLILDEGLEVHLLSLPDLVAAKKTQRDKDWPMLRALVEVNYEEFFDHPNPDRVRFWLEELRTLDLLIEAVTRFPDEARRAADSRGAVAAAITGDGLAVQQALDEEMARERDADRAYWAPLRQELEQLRRTRTRG